MKHFRKKCVLGFFVSVFLASLIWVVSLQGLNLAGEDNAIRFNKDDSMRTLETKLQAMREEIKRNGDTFEVGMNSAMQYPLEELCSVNLNSKPENSTLYENNEPKKMADLDPVFLPAYYMGYYTPIKNQGAMNDAWAYATMGVMEGNIKKVDGITVDLSEAFIFWCNVFGCNWFCHDMNMAPYGAVLECDYDPNGGYCPAIIPWSYRISGWGYVGNSYSVPTVSAIKQKILAYGSVACGVYVDSYFQAYTSGCFSRNATGSINHFVLLVGWDESKCTTGAWRLKNCWGTGWGESGLMWIKYGVQKVGYAANYVVYP